MSMFSNAKHFRLHIACIIAIACGAFAAPAAGQRSAEPEDRDQIDAESSPSDDEKALLKAIEEQRRAAEQQRAEAAEQYRRAMSELERVRRRGSSEAQAEMEKMRAQLEMAQAALAELAAKQQQEVRLLQAQADPLPEGTVLRVYHLQHIKPQNLAAVLAPIFRNNAPRIAVDERSNSLLVAGNEKQISVVEELAQTLDRPSPEAGESDPRNTLQVRILWLLDIDEGTEPTDKLVSPQVVDALGELGFEHPKVICQQVATLTLGENRGGQYQFQVPVLIKSQQWQFEGKGFIGRMANDRFHVEFNLSFQQVMPNGQAFGQISRLGGSIHTPLAHYTVMGTTTFVGQAPAPLPDDRQSGEFGTGGVVQNQHLSAFVVYLDRAREFPASSGNAEDRNSERRR